MNRLKAAFVCASIVLCGIALLARAQAPGKKTAPNSATNAARQPVDDLFATPEGAAKSAAPTFPGAGEKSVLAQPPKEFESTEPASTDKCRCIGDGNSIASKRINTVLASPLHKSGLDYQDQPLDAVVTQLSEEYGIPIQLNKNALEDAGVGTDSKIRVSLHNITLRSALRLMLDQLSLTYLIRDEVLLITTKEDAEKRLVTCVYNVQGLVDDADPKSIKALIEAMYACVAADTWAENEGGMAEARPLSPGLLVVSQTWSVHEEVGSLLDQIRKMREQVPISKAGPRLPETPASRSSSAAPEKKEKAVSANQGGAFFSN
jgi:hypothetical protein